MSTSKLLFERLHNRFGRIHIQIPRSWSDDHCFSAGFIGKHQPSNSSKYDMIIGPYDKSETGIPWTQQSFGCREPGDFIYIPSTFLNKSQNHHHDNQEMADHMFRQWTKFYHGLFDDNVLSSNVTSGSRQDSFCLGSTPLSIIHSRSVLFLFTIHGFILDTLTNSLDTNFLKFDFNVKSVKYIISSLEGW